MSGKYTVVVRVGVKCGQRSVGTAGLCSESFEGCSGTNRITAESNKLF